MSPRPVRLTPGELTSSWPTSPSDDPIGEVARHIAVNLSRAIGDRSLREVARLSGVDRLTLGEFLEGNRWPDMVFIAKLESALHVRLWPDHVGEAKG